MTASSDKNKEENEQLNKMPHKELLSAFDQKFCDNIASKTQLELLCQMIKVLFQGIYSDYSDTQTQLKLLQSILYFYQPLSIQTILTKIGLNSYNSPYNIIELCILGLPNQFNESCQFISYLKQLSTKGLHQFMVNKSSSDCPLNDDLFFVISDFVTNININVYEYNYCSDEYPKSFHHGPNYCLIKSLVVTHGYLAIEYDEHADVNDHESIQPWSFSKIYGTTIGTKRVKCHSNFEFDLNTRRQGRCIFAVCHKNLEIEDTFSYGVSGYSRVKFIHKELKEEIIKQFQP